VWLDSSGIEVLPTDIGNSPMKNGGKWWKMVV